AEVPESVPVVMNEILVIGLHRSGADPQVPVEPGGRLFRFLEADRVAVAGKEEVGLIDVANFPRVDKLNGLAPAPPPAALRAAGGNTLVLAGGLDKLRALPYIVRDRVLDVHVLASLHGPDGGESVPVIGGRDGDRVDAFVFEDAAHIGLDLRTFAGLLRDGGSGGFGSPAVDVDHGGDFDISHRQDFADMRGAP